MARSTPWRTSGSPPRRSSRASALPSPSSLWVAVSLPVSSRPQVAALTNSDGLRPRCARQSPRPILSRMSASRVAASGVRSSASARHIRATPSWEDSAYSCSSACTSPSRPAWGARARSAPASRWARAATRSRCASGRRACSSRAGSNAVSAARWRGGSARMVSARGHVGGAKGGGATSGAGDEDSRGAFMVRLPRLILRKFAADYSE
jgi:hypothetical protein